MAILRGRSCSGLSANLLTRSCFISLALASIFLAGCGGNKKPRARVAPPPEIQHPSSPSGQPQYSGKPLYVETGLASWYGPPYHNRKSASGEVFDMHDLTAAHKTLPMNSIVRVTALGTGKSVIVRINDRGPFVGDRILDLSLGAAKEIGVWRAGLARVRVEVLEAPKPIDSGGRWCVQVGAFSDYDEAAQYKARLLRRYSSAKVIQFTGPTGEWVRIRPLNDDRARAQEVARENRAGEVGVFLVRLD
ncbi:MAG: septal ring lytic transglycosylase RlpA family protein [Acidobacteriales bacterium]|nr:septal ring lytic transglycosylase RlpA family protein [Terriglobales bacterium]